MVKAPRPIPIMQILLMTPLTIIGGQKSPIKILCDGSRAPLFLNPKRFIYGTKNLFCFPNHGENPKSHLWCTKPPNGVDIPPKDQGSLIKQDNKITIL